MKVNGAPGASPSTPAPIESGAMPGRFPASGLPVSGLATRSSAATRPRNSPGIFASVKNFLFGPEPPLPEPPPSTLSWPTGHRAPEPPSPEDAVGRLRQGGLPQSVQHPKLAGYRGDVGSDGDITRVEFYLQGQAGLVRVPMTEGDNSTDVAAMQIGGIVAAQLDTPRLGGYERVPASQDIAFRVGRQYVKPALTAQAQPNKLAAFLGTQPEAPPEQANRCKWEAFPLGNGHYLVPAIGLPEYGVPPYSRSACVATMALMRGQPMREIGPKLERGRPSLEDMGSTLFSHFGVAPEQVEGKTDSEASFAKLVNALQHKLRSNGAATIETGATPSCCTTSSRHPAAKKAWRWLAMHVPDNRLARIRPQDRRAQPVRVQIAGGWRCRCNHGDGEVLSAGRVGAIADMMKVGKTTVWRALAPHEPQAGRVTRRGAGVPAA